MSTCTMLNPALQLRLRPRRGRGIKRGTLRATGFADAVPQVCVDAGLAPCPGCDVMLSTVQDAGGRSQWERHVDECGA